MLAAVTGCSHARRDAGSFQELLARFLIAAWLG
jgi:hypothetical protein